MNSSYYVDTSYGISETTGLLSVLAGIGIFMWIVTMAIGILMIISMWKIFTKAGKPGWAAIIPIYNIYIMCEIADKPWWYILLLCVPFANIYAMFVIYDGIAKKFGKTTGFTIGMIFLPFIFFSILGLSKNSVYLDNIESSNDNSSVDELTEETPQTEPVLNDSYVGEVEPISQTNTGYVAPTFDTPVAGATPIMNEPVTPVAQPAPMMSEPVTPVAQPAPMMSEPVTPVAQSAPMMSEQVAPVAQPAPMMNEPVTPVAPQQEVNQINNDAHTSLWSNNNTNNSQM